MKFSFSPHTLFESKLAGSTSENIVKKAASLKRTHLAYTDFGLMTSFAKVYFLCLQNNIKIVPGIQCFLADHIFCKDKRVRYYTVTLYAPTEKQYAFLCDLASRQNKNLLFYQESVPVITWNDINEAAERGLYLVTGPIHDATSKLIILKQKELAVKTHIHFLNLFKERYFISIVGQQYDKEWMDLIKITLQDGRNLLLRHGDTVSTNAFHKAKASELINYQIHHTINSVYKNNRFFKIPNGKISSAEDVSGFVPFSDGDLQKNVNVVNLAIAKLLGINVLYSDYAFYAEKEDKVAQSVRLSQNNLKDYPLRIMQDTEGAVNYMTKIMGLTVEEANKILANNDLFASVFNDFILDNSYKLPKFEGNVDILNYVLSIVRNNKRIDLNNQVYKYRLAHEISVLQNNGKVALLEYFIPIIKIIEFYKQNNRLVGPSRGSAGGSLLLYALGITHVDPIKYDLSFERFLSLDRILAGDLPDVDIDLVCRDPLVGSEDSPGFLYQTWKDKAAQISTRTLLRLKSSIRDVNRHVEGKLNPEIEKIAKVLPAAPQGVDDLDFIFGMSDAEGKKMPGLIDVNEDLNYYINNWPKEWDIVKKCLGLNRQFSKHASAFVISSRPIKEYMPLFLGNTIQYEAKWVEKLGFIKYDFLVVNQLKDIELCLKYIKERDSNQKTLPVGEFIFSGKVVHIWNLPEIENVFKSVWDGDTHSIFQINTNTMIPFVKRIRPRSIEDISTILALVRPGPLDYVDEQTGLNMAEEYILRRNGGGNIKIPKLVELLPETYGIMCYQEQVSKIAKELGGMSSIDAEKLRRFFSKKQKAQAQAMKPIFMENAIKNVDVDTAELIWSQMETFSRYGFNKSHSIGYSIITYACMFLRYFYPLEWWAAIISNATEEEIKTELYEKIKNIMGNVDINLSDKTVKIDYENNKIIPKLSLISGLGEITMDNLIKNRPYNSLEDFVRKKPVGPSIAYNLIYAGILDSLFDPNMTDLQKLYEYEATRQRILNPKKNIKNVKICTEYLAHTPLEKFKIIKKTVPNSPEKLSNLILENFEKIRGTKIKDKYLFFNSSNSKDYVYVTGEELKKIVDSNLEFGHSLICSAAFIIQMKEVSYSKGTKKFLKMSVDIDGFVSEQILWPDYETNLLNYDKETKKHSIAMLYFYINKNKGRLVLQYVKNIC